MTTTIIWLDNLCDSAYNILTGTKSYETPSAKWRYNVISQRITQYCKRGNMKYATIDYSRDNRTWYTHIDRVLRQSRWIHKSA